MLSRSRSTLALAGAATALAVVPAGAAQAKTVITMSGSTSVAPLAAKLAKTYVRSHNVKFRLLQGGSDVGIADVARGRVTIGNSSRDPKSGDPGGITFNPIARDAICLITNKANPLGNVSQATVQGIFSGRVRSWSQVPGARVSGPIDLVVRTAASGTQDAFQKIFMNPSTVSNQSSKKASNGLVQQAVVRNHNAIGYVSLAFTKGAHSLRYKGVGCTLRNAKSGQYGGVRTFYMVTRGKPKGAVRSWIRWIRSNKVARRITATEWVPLS
jgi:phosphate transport system substrate-binding protein